MRFFFAFLTGYMKTDIAMRIKKNHLMDVSGDNVKSAILA